MTMRLMSEMQDQESFKALPPSQQQQLAHADVDADPARALPAAAADTAAAAAAAAAGHRQTVSTVSRVLM